MSFAQFVALLVAACLLILGSLGSLMGGFLGVAEAARLSAATFAAAVLVQRRGPGDWLPITGWMLLGAAGAVLLLPPLGVDATLGSDNPAFLWAEIGWRLLFLLLLLRGAPGWGDGALLAACCALSRSGGYALTLFSLDAWREGPLAVIFVLGGLLAGLLGMLLPALLLGWLTGKGALGRGRVLAWLGALAVLADLWLALR